MKYTTPIVIIVSLVFFSCKEEQKVAEESLLDKAHRIHKKVITIDTHNDINVKNFTDSINYTQLLETQVNLPKMKTGGLDISWLIVYTDQDSLTSNDYSKAWEYAMEKFEAIHRLSGKLNLRKLD